MFLPTADIAPDRCIATTSAMALKQLDESPMSVSALWNHILAERNRAGFSSPMTFEWYVLSLDALYALGLIERQGSILVRVREE